MEQQKLPNATLILVFGIISIVTCCCYGVIGLIFGIIGLILANKATKLYALSPELYEGYNNVKLGKTLSIIGIVLNILVVIFFIWIISIIGWDALQNEELMRERMEDYLGNME
ncbi:CCC motif membrane protein [Arenibacter latericius]|uniref:CCC motif membrane protein n=1 Tax=Arenibacter latericius TaxID=86104 RepID=UPI000403CC8D|nr:CCC motif membrane protein [Arenibacter latericius]MDX1364666.1 CCC motif membrane protein [Arenibacter latericius]